MKQYFLLVVFYLIVIKKYLIQSFELLSRKQKKEKETFTS